MVGKKQIGDLTLNLVRLTEAAALSGGWSIGCGEKLFADEAAVDAMRKILNSMRLDGTIVIGEGEKDRAPMLISREKRRSDDPPKLGIAVEPIDGTRPLSLGLPNSIATVALAPRGTMFNLGLFFYMDKIAVGVIAKNAVDINAPIIDDLNNVAKAKGGRVNELTVVVVDRPSREKLIFEICKTGARIKLIPDGDISGAILCAIPESNIDLLFGVGGTPEGVVAEVAMRCLGGTICGKLHAYRQIDTDYAQKMI